MRTATRLPAYHPTLPNHLIVEEDGRLLAAPLIPGGWGKRFPVPGLGRAGLRTLDRFQRQELRLIGAAYGLPAALIEEDARG